MKYLDTNLELLTTIGLNAEKWWIRHGVQNGLAVYATWSTITAILNLAALLEHSSSALRLAAGQVALITMLTFVVFWAFLELIFLRRYTRYLLMPYATFIWAFNGILAKRHCNPDWVLSDQNDVLIITGLVFPALVIAIKMAMLLHTRVEHFCKQNIYR